MSSLAIGALGSVVSGMLQSGTNTQNLIQQKIENEKGRDFARGQGLLSQRYNSPGLQVNRLRAAGINPDASNISPGSYSSQNPSLGTVPPGVAPFQSLGENLMSGINNDVQNRNVEANTRKVNLESDKTVEDIESVKLDNIIKQLQEQREQDKWNTNKNQLSKQLEIAIGDYYIRQKLADLERDKYNENIRQFNDNLDYSYYRLQQEMNMALQQYNLDRDKHSLNVKMHELNERKQSIDEHYRALAHQQDMFNDYMSEFTFGFGGSSGSSGKGGFGLGLNAKLTPNYYNDDVISRSLSKYFRTRSKFNNEFDKYFPKYDPKK